MNCWRALLRFFIQRLLRKFTILIHIIYIKTKLLVGSQGFRFGSQSILEILHQATMNLCLQELLNGGCKTTRQLSTHFDKIGRNISLKKLCFRSVISKFILINYIKKIVHLKVVYYMTTVLIGDRGNQYAFLQTIEGHKVLDMT